MVELIVKCEQVIVVVNLKDERNMDRAREIFANAIMSTTSRDVRVCHLGLQMWLWLQAYVKVFTVLSAYIIRSISKITKEPGVI